MGGLIPIVSRSAGITQFVAGDQFPAVSFKKALANAGKIASAACPAMVFLQACTHDAVDQIIPPWVDIIGFVANHTIISGNLIYQEPTNSSIKGVTIVTTKTGVNCVRLDNGDASICRVDISDSHFESEDAANIRVNSGAFNVLRVQRSFCANRGTDNNPSGSALIEAVTGSSVSLHDVGIISTDVSNNDAIDSEASALFMRGCDITGEVNTEGTVNSYFNVFNKASGAAHIHNGSSNISVGDIYNAPGPDILDTTSGAPHSVARATNIFGSLQGGFVASDVDFQSLPTMVDDGIQKVKRLASGAIFIFAVGEERSFRFSGVGVTGVLTTANLYDGIRFTFINETGATANFIGGNGKNINGNPTYSLPNAYDKATVEYDAINDEWLVITD